jgi:hypothetical protein
MNDPANNPREGLFSHTDDFVKLTEAARKYPKIHEIELDNQSHYDNLIEITKNDENIIPIFLKTLDGDLKIMSSYSKEFKDIKKGYKLVYLGKAFDIGKIDMKVVNEF